LLDEAEHLCDGVEDREKVKSTFEFPHLSLTHIAGNAILTDTLSAILEMLSFMLPENKTVIGALRRMHLRSPEGFGSS
jgi:hypothetical protein